MSEYTPTTERVRDTWTNAMSEGCASNEELADAEWDTDRRDAQFDRWLAAHDAEVRAHARHEFCDPTPGCVVAEEPEWEYGYELLESDTRDVLARGWPFDTAQEAKERADLRAAEELEPDYPPLIPQIVRRHEAGPWVPVKQEGADQ